MSQFDVRARSLVCAVRVKKSSAISNLHKRRSICTVLTLDIARTVWSFGVLFSAHYALTIAFLDISLVDT